MAFNKVLVVAVIVGSVAGSLTRTETNTTPVPILRFIDTRNNDGSYTYGYESADGSYKIENRLATGEVKGKYGYIDTDGNLKVVEYGGSAERGFEPRIEGVVVAPPTLVDDTEVRQADIVPVVVEEERPVRTGSRFANFRARNGQRRENVKNVQVVENNIKIVNGRRAVLKKRLRAKTSPQVALAPIDPEQLRQEQLRAREQAIRDLETERQALLRLHQVRYNIPTSAPANTRFQANNRVVQGQREVFRSHQVAPQAPITVEDHPYISNYNAGSGTFSYSYRK